MKGIILLTGALALCARPAGAAAPKVEIVESVPVETSLDHPDIRNTPEIWLEMIRGARKTLDIEQFYLSHKAGEPLEPIVDAIAAAGRRGVKVRIIADSKFYKIYPKTLDRLAKGRNVSLRIIDVGRFTGGIMHAKYFIVDGKTVFMGSQNFDWRALKHIRELGVRVEDKGFARIVLDLFELDWKLCGPEEAEKLRAGIAPKTYDVPVKVSEDDGSASELTPVFSPPKLLADPGLFNEDRLLELIDGAKRDVMLQVLSYSPISRKGEYYPKLDNALRRAAARGVKVRIIVSDWNKRPPAIHHLKSLSVLPNVRVKLSTIPPWSGGFVPFARVEHCKLLIADKKAAWVGSSNWSKDYFHNSRNVGVVIRGKRPVGQLRKFFFTGWMGPYTSFVDPAREYVPPQVGD